MARGDYGIDMKLMQKLIDAHGVSGNEGEIRDVILKEIEPYVDEISIGKLGSLIAHKKGKGPKVMLTAHMDEIGLMVRNIDKRGKIFFSAIGGLTPITLLGQRVHVRGKDGKKIFGVITTEEISNDAEFEKLPVIEDMYIDTGYWGKKLKHFGVEIGSYVEFESNIKNCPCHQKMVFGKALDDRVGCYMLLEVAKKLKKTYQDIYYVFTVQEEVGLYGAKTTAWKIEPDWAIVIDVTVSNDNVEYSTKILGRGPILTVKDAEVIGNLCIDNWIKKIARQKKIPIQVEVSDTGTTDALGVSVSKAGVPTSILGVAIRNLHTSFGLSHKRDIKNNIKLLTELMKNAQDCIPGVGGENMARRRAKKTTRRRTRKTTRKRTRKRKTTRRKTTRKRTRRR